MEPLASFCQGKIYSESLPIVNEGTRQARNSAGSPKKTAISITKAIALKLNQVFKFEILLFIFYSERTSQRHPKLQPLHF
jgi:hypothetical protein